MFSINDCRFYNGVEIKPDSNVTWDVSGLLKLGISVSEMAKILCFLGLFLMTLIGCIIIYNDGTIISNDTSSPPPIPVDGGWTKWSPWSSCSGTCQTDGFLSTQIRSRTCSSPPPRDGGKPCEGEVFNKRVCPLLIQCPVDDRWEEWQVVGPCESITGKPCTIGKKLYSRKCNKTVIRSTETDCKGLKERNEDCWFDIGCPVVLQPPSSIQVFSNGSAVFEVQWSSVPYGITATKYRLYLAAEDKDSNQIATIHTNISVIPPVEVSGRRYSMIADMRRFLTSGSFVTLVVRISSYDYWDNESRLSNPVQSRVGYVDGQWSQWDHWSECSTHCLNKRGSRVRKRRCDNPQPTEGGKQCAGKDHDEVSCIGMETEC